MRRKKVFTKLFAVLLSCLLVGTFAACGKGKGSDSELSAGSDSVDTGSENSGTLKNWEEEVDQNLLTFTLSEDGSYYILTKCATEAKGRLRIPAEYNGSPVKEIGGYEAFENCFYITSVEIPESITKIGEAAFGSCLRLTEIYNRSALSMEAGSYARFPVVNVATKEEELGQFTQTEEGYIFYENRRNSYLIAYLGGETQLKLPEKFRGGTYEIGTGAFSFCNALTSVEIREGVTSIGKAAFGYCNSLTNIKIPGSVKSIEGWAFTECGATNIEIPESVTEIGEEAFSSCKALTNIRIPGSVKSIGAWAFSDCIALTSAEIGEGVTGIGEKAFLRCNNLTDVIFKAPAGWSAGDTALPENKLSDSKTAAAYLTGTYCHYTWTKKA